MATNDFETRHAAGDGSGTLADEIILTTDRDAIVTEAPKERFRLGFFSTACLLINRMIGTGIFNSPGTVIRGTNSTGGAMLLWFAGTLYGLAGIHVYIEYGLNVPRYVIDGIEQAVPRSGADLHYLQYVYRWWYYKKDTVLLSGCLFGISFICIGNMASNCIAFAVRVLAAADVGQGTLNNNGLVRGIALAAAAFACIIHSVSRRGGIWLSNFLACVKVGILLLIIVAAIRVGVLGKGVIQGNFQTAFTAVTDTKKLKATGAHDLARVDGGARGYAKAFLSIIFAFSGFDQANYVLGEISRPRKTYPRAAFFAVGLVSVLYIVINVCYMAVVTAFEQQHGLANSPSPELVALLFFKHAFPSDTNSPDRAFNALLALSSFGNVIVMTYTAARMKQEIAKQGFLPFPQFLGRNFDVSLGRLVVYLRTKGLHLRFITPENHREPTPVGALLLHLLSCIILIFATFGMEALDAYDLLSGLIAYLTTAWFGTFLALGILILRVFGPPQTENSGPGQPEKTWKEMTKGSGINSYLSVACALLYLVLNLFPVIVSWIQSAVTLDASATLAWWLVPGISWIVLGFSFAWWVGFLVLANYRSKKQQKEFVYEIRPEFDWAEPGRHGDGEGRGDDGKVLAHETVVLAWVGGEMGMFAESEGWEEGRRERRLRGKRLKHRQGTVVSVEESRAPGRTDFDEFDLGEEYGGDERQESGMWRA
ncbi:amino acid permease-domain-containing protein [Schizothecium vesticola]|uniref:Amino acid permease-domain-containing protein n=1 Tax=Schizothecium vesticola TaxID=314040 RepID=A0AA40F7M8_9PEZI|nr:amino acid permease-domain-containing protein [Schizothecium vesticola]